MVGGTNHQTIVLGGGLSGLSAAYYGDFPVFESQDFPGGTAASIRKNKFTFDYGIHVLNSKDSVFYDLLRELGVAVAVNVRKGFIYGFGSLASYPIQINTHHLPVGKCLQCVWGYVFRKKNAVPKNYEEWLIKNFGAGFSRNFLIPYAEKFWGGDPKEMTFDWTDVRVPQASLSDVLKGALRNQDTKAGPNAEFRYPSEPGAGFAAIGDALASRVRDIRFSMKATAIDPHEKIVSFDKNKTEVRYENLITTIPLPELVRLISRPPAAVLEATNRLRWNSIAVINLGIDRPRINDGHWIHFPEKEISFFRISFPNNFCKGLSPENKSPIQAEVSYNAQNPPPKEQLLQRVRSDLIKTGIIDKNDKISFEEVHYLPYGYVIYDFNRQESVRIIHDYLKKHQIFPCGRYGEWAYLWCDEAIYSGKKAAEKLQ